MQTKASPDTTVRVLYVATGAVTLALVAYVIFATTKLRPIADDYCIAAVATSGVPSAMVHWYTNWSGDTFVWLSNTLFVGLPLVWTPWELASALPFLLASTLVSTATFLGIRHCTSMPLLRIAKKDALAFSILFLLALVAWWSYWWAPLALGATDQQTRYAEGLLHWQNLNSAYVIPIGIILVLCYLFSKYHESRRRIAFLIAATIAVVAALSGPIIASTFLVVLSLSIIRDVLTCHKWRRKIWLRRATMLAIAGLLLVFTVLSPGTRERRATMESLPSPLQSSPTEIFQKIVPEFITEWAQAVFSLGTLMATALLFLAGIAFAALGFQSSPRRLVSLAGLILFSSLIMSLMTQVSHLFVYSAYWHNLSFVTLVFIAAAFVGFASGYWLASTLPIDSSLAYLFVALVTLPLGQLALGYLYVAADNRLDSWVIGPAPTTFIADVESKSGWGQCWQTIAEFREAPIREYVNDISPPIPVPIQVGAEGG